MAIENEIKKILKRYEVVLKARIQSELKVSPLNQIGTRNSGDVLRVFGKKDSLLRAIDVGFKNGSFNTEVNKSYAAIQERGGTVRQKVSSKQKKYFFAKYYETKKDVWRAMALSEFLKIRIKARPYLKPALDKFVDEDLEKMLDRMVEAVVDEF